MNTAEAIQTWESIDGELSSMNDVIKEKRGNKKTIEADIVRSMIEEHSVPFIDSSGTGEGPYYILRINTGYEGWKKDKFVAFFTQLRNEIENNGGVIPPAEALAEAANTFQKKFERKTIELKRCTKLASVCSITALKDVLAEQSNNNSMNTGMNTGPVTRQRGQ